jgi:CubicO group peptidase (beta-lactamase class C family)
MADLQAEVQAAAGELVAAGTETGLQVAVLRHGRVLADVVSGVADPQTAQPVTPGTLFYAASAAKGVAASLAHVLAERGDITYDLRLADVWPEFAARGKEHTTLRHVLLHTAGLPGLPRETTVADLCDWDRVCAALAAAEPWWRPGTRFGYHALTFGFLLGETLRRATGRTIARQAASPPPEPPEKDSPLDRATPPALRDAASFGNRADVLSADIPSLGTMTARGAARVYAALLGHVDGIELVSDRRRTAMAAVAFTGTDEVMGFPASWAFGYSPDRPGGVPSRRGSTFGMVGANGSAAYADIDSGLAVAVMRNGPPAAGLAAVTRIDRLIAETEEHQ